MKVLLSIACVMVCVLAEPPPSKGYLPPAARGGGYPAPAQPGVIAARSQGAPALRSGAGGFARSAAGVGGYGGGRGYGGNGVEDGFGSEPASYNFDYSVADGVGGAEFGHQESRQEERAEGEYHVLLPDGRKQTVSYEADEGGFKPRISYEDTGAGYDTNAQSSGRSSGGYDSNASLRSGHSSGYDGNAGLRSGHSSGHDGAGFRSGHSSGHDGNAGFRSGNGYGGNGGVRSSNSGFASTRSGGY